MRFVDIMIIAFVGGIHRSHGHVLLNMRYNTTLIAINRLIETMFWLASSVEYATSWKVKSSTQC